MYMTVGTLDDRVLSQTGPPPLAKLPLDPRALMGEQVIASAIEAHLKTAGLREDDVAIHTHAHSTSLRWPATGSGPGGGLMRFSVLEGLHHNYPNGRNNPAGFEAAPQFWDFFVDHPLA
jgi:hypothetical protein